MSRSAVGVDRRPRDGEAAAEPLREARSLYGRVVSGRGNATGDLGDCANDLEQITGTRLHPGSLNLVLSRPVRLDFNAAEAFADGFRFIWPARIGEHAVWIYRWLGAPLHALEVLSPQCLRRAFGVSDGDTVAVKLDPALIETLCVREQVAWAAAWAGRRAWCYTNDRYYMRTAGWCSRHGVTQAI